MEEIDSGVRRKGCVVYRSGGARRAVGLVWSDHAAWREAESRLDATRVQQATGEREANEKANELANEWATGLDGNARGER
jgi:hypothetical protein